MNNRRGLLLTILAAILTLLLTACGSSFDAEGYVQAALDAAFRGDNARYVQLTGLSEKDAAKGYEAVLDALLEPVKELELSDKRMAKYRDFFDALLQQTRYEVRDSYAWEGQDNYIVELEIQPLTGVFDDLPDTMESLMKQYLRKAMRRGEQPKQGDYTQWVSKKLLTHLVETSKEPVYGEAETVRIRVTKDKDGGYAVSKTDVAAAAGKLIDERGLRDAMDLLSETTKEKTNAMGIAR